MTDPLEQRYRIHPLCAWRRIDDHVFVLTDRDDFVTLDDPVGLIVWQALEAGPSEGAALLEAVTARFDVSDEQARQDLAEFLVTLVDGHAVEVC